MEMSKMWKHPEQYELWADLSLQNKHLRRNNWVHWAAHLFLVLALVLAAIRPMTAIRVDHFGRAELVSGILPSNSPGPEEAEHITRLLSSHLLEVTSGAVARDLQKALGLMTSDFARAYRQKTNEDTSLALLERGNVRTQVSFDSKFTEVKAEKDGAGRVTKYFVQLFGQAEVYRADVLTAPLLARQVRVRATLLVVPRTPNTLNGLLVDYFEKDFVTEDVDSPPPINSTPLLAVPVAKRAP